MVKSWVGQPYAAGPGYSCQEAQVEGQRNKVPPRPEPASWEEPAQQGSSVSPPSRSCMLSFTTPGTGSRGWQNKAPLLLSPAPDLSQHVSWRGGGGGRAHMAGGLRSVGAWGQGLPRAGARWLRLGCHPARGPWDA